MAKKREELENGWLRIVPEYKSPNSFEKVDKQPDNTCKCGCKKQVDFYTDSYIIVDEMIFWDDSCVTDYFIHQAGGRRVYGGAC